MSREIKFRAVMPDERVKALGFKLFYQRDQYLGSFLRRANTFAFQSSGHDSYGVPTLEQYTGLKDKNNVEIFEGDLVKCEGICEPTEVFFNQYTGAWEPFASTHYPVKDWEIIGNFHETEGKQK